MTTSNHASAGTQVYGYNHANQRVFVRNGNTVADDPEGLGGERLMEFQETCTSGACTSYTETQRWIYFAGRKMFQKTGTTLKAITPNRLASEAKHFPYGETDGPPPADTKDYFATYRRDGTGLDYAWNRYYSPTMGRFTTADPYGGSEDSGLPESWNRYSYVGSDPGNRTDSTGLFWDPFSLMQGPVAGDWGAGPFSMPDVWGLPWFVPFGLPQPEYPYGVPEGTPPFLPTAGGRGPGRTPMIQNIAAGAAIPIIIEIGVLSPEVGVLILLAGEYWRIISERNKQNVADTGIKGEVDAIRQANPNLDPCAILKSLQAAAEAENDTQRLIRIKMTQKALGCRASRQSRGR